MKRTLKLLGILCVLAVLTATAAMFVSAQTTAPETCPQCEKAVTWVGLSTVADGASTIAAGHYVYDYAEDTHNWTAEKAVSGAVCICIPEGKTLTATKRVFSVSSGGILSFCGTGTVQGGHFASTDSATTARYGGAVHVKAGGRLVLREATLTDAANQTSLLNSSNGGVVCVNGTFDMYSGTVRDGKASNAGGNIFVAPTGVFNMYGGNVSGGTCTAGKSVCAQGKVLLAGNATINHLYLWDKTHAFAEMLTVQGAYTGTATVQYRSATYAEGMDAGVADNASLMRANLRLNNESWHLTVDGTDLKITATAPTYTKNIYCRKCGENKEFAPLTEQTAAETSLSDGHYYLDVLQGSAAWAQKAISGKVCIDLNGQTVQGAGRLFSVTGELNVQGEGTLTSGGFAAAGYDGGVFNVGSNGELNIYGGTFKAGKYGTNTQFGSNGGVLYVTGVVNMYGGTMIGGNVSNIGGAVFVAPAGTANFHGGKVTSATDKAVFAQGKVSLSGDAQLEMLHLRYRAGSPVLSEQLIIDGTYYGVVTVEFHTSLNADLSANAVIGKAVNNADIRHASISLLDDSDKAIDLFPVTDNGKLILSAELPTPLTREGLCSVCGESVTWTSLTEAYAGQSEIKTGHYYLDFGGNSGAWASKDISGKVCLDLNGQTLTGTTRAFIVNSGSALNLIGEGTVMGRGRATSVSVEYRAGGTILVERDATLNLYEATLTSDEVSGFRGGNGGVVNVAGIFNMYGGAVKNGIAGNAGGNIFITTTGTMNMYGGSISGGTCGTAKSVACRGKMTVSGDASVNEAYLWPDSAGPALSEMLTISGKYTGTMTLRLAAANRVVGKDIGIALQADLSEATLSVVGSELVPVVLGPELVLMGDSPVLTLNGTDIVSGYASLADAIEAYTDPAHRIVLFGDVADVEVTKDVYVDLNGWDITGTVSGTGTLYVMDSQTDDFTIVDGNFGTVPVGKNVAAIPQESACTEDGYLMIEKEGRVSFHRVQVLVTSMSLRPGDVGLYFKCSYGGDEMVQTLVESFGVSLNAQGDPVAPAFAQVTLSTVSGKDEFSAGATNTSVLVYGIMKDGKGDAANAQRAQMQIYGRAYIRFAGDQVIYGACRNRSLVEQVAGNSERVGIDAMWDGLEANQKFGVYNMYLKFKTVMDGWNITNIPAEAPADQAELAQMRADEAVLKARREQVVAKMRAMGDLYWRATEDITYHISSNARWVDFYAGRVYRGMPYAYARSDEQTFLEFASEPDEKGIYNISGLTEDHLGNGSSLARIGNDCSGSVNFAWNQVGAAISGTNSSRYMIEANGYLKVGDYEYTPTEDGRVGISKEIVAANGQERMFAAYAKVQPGDALDTTTAAGGHVILVVGKKVVYNPDGSIDGARSYIHTLEQTPGPVSRGVETCSWNEELGEVVYTIYKEVYMPFDQAFSSGYLPITCQVLIDASPVEAAKVEDSLDASEYSYENMFTGVFTTNRMVSSVTLSVFEGEDEVFHVTGSGIRAKIKSYDLQNFLTENYEGHMVLRGALEVDKLVVGNTYRCTVEVVMGSGEKIVARDYTFVATDADITTPTPSDPGDNGGEEEEGDITENPDDPGDPGDLV